MSYSVKLVYIAGKPTPRGAEYRVPVALHSLGNYLMSQKGMRDKVTLEIHAFSSRDSHDRMLRSLNPEDAGIIGVSCYIWNVRKTLRLVE